MEPTTLPVSTANLTLGDLCQLIAARRVPHALDDDAYTVSVGELRRWLRETGAPATLRRAS